MTGHRTLGMALAAAITALAAVTGADAGDRPRGVVELFTSQGCNSCPPADEVFGGLARSGDIVALGYHVDYWDYLGWKDTLASHGNTQRQYAYAKSFGSRSVYTPQAVINGSVDVNGAQGKAIDGKLASLDAEGKGLSVDVDIEHSGDTMIIDTGDADGGQNNAHVVLVFFGRAKPVEIKRGENSGRTITYWNAVSDVQTAGMWHGKAKRYEFPMSEVARKGDGGCAVLLQTMNADGSPGQIIGAAMMTREGS